ncbi:hypothetical protein LINPERHAP1_LOCUS34753 [Linum perenne]
MTRFFIILIINHQRIILIINHQRNHHHHHSILSPSPLFRPPSICLLRSKLVPFSEFQPRFGEL